MEFNHHVEMFTNTCNLLLISAELQYSDLWEVNEQKVSAMSCSSRFQIQWVRAPESTFKAYCQLGKKSSDLGNMGKKVLTSNFSELNVPMPYREL